MHKITLQYQKISVIIVSIKTKKIPCIEGYRVATPVHSLCVLTDAGFTIYFRPQCPWGPVVFCFKKGGKIYEVFLLPLRVVHGFYVMVRVV